MRKTLDLKQLLDFIEERVMADADTPWNSIRRRMGSNPIWYKNGEIIDGFEDIRVDEGYGRNK